MTKEEEMRGNGGVHKRYMWAYSSIYDFKNEGYFALFQKGNLEGSKPVTEKLWNTVVNWMALEAVGLNMQWGQGFYLWI